MAVADNAILRVVGNLLFPDSVIAQNVFYALFDDTGTSSDEEDVAADLADWVDAILADILYKISNGITAGIATSYVYDSVDDDWDEIGVSNLASVFTNTADMAPHGVAAVQTARVTDPDSYARKFYSGFSDTSFDGSDLTADTMTAMVA